MFGQEPEKNPIYKQWAEGPLIQWQIQQLQRPLLQETCEVKGYVDDVKTQIFSDWWILHKDHARWTASDVSFQLGSIQMADENYTAPTSYPHRPRST